MTIKLVSTPSGVGKAEIIAINLPDELMGGSRIAGSFVLKNVGEAEAEFRILITTIWDDKKYSAAGVVPVGGLLTAGLSSVNIIMPNQDAIIQADGQRMQEGNWVTDDTKSH